MTLHEVANQIHDLTAGTINGEHFTKTEFNTTLRRWMGLGEQMIFELTLPDGRWLCKVYEIRDGYDYFLPDTREQERELYKELGVA